MSVSIQTRSTDIRFHLADDERPKTRRVGRGRISEMPRYLALFAMREYPHFCLPELRSLARLYGVSIAVHPRVGRPDSVRSTAGDNERQ
jgi:hypothetical protein